MTDKSLLELINISVTKPSQAIEFGQMQSLFRSLLILQNNSSIQTVTGNPVDNSDPLNPVILGEPVYTHEKTLTAANLTSISSTPVDLGIPNPGAGKVIHLFPFYIIQMDVATPFINNPSFIIRYHTQSGSQIYTAIPQAVIRAAASDITPINITQSGGATIKMIANDYLEFFSTSGDFANGTGSTATFHFKYQIVTL